MGYIDSLKSIEGQKGIFSIVLTATILTVFEILFFYMIVVPGVNKNLDDKLSKMGKDLGNTINKSNEKVQKKNAAVDVVLSQSMKIPFNAQLKGVVNTMADREALLVDKINFYTKATGVVIILMLCVILWLLWGSIKGTEGVDTDMSTSVYSALFTVVLLIGFQVMFYFFSQQYLYPGSVGQEELVDTMLSAIDTSVKEEKGTLSKIGGAVGGVASGAYNAAGDALNDVQDGAENAMVNAKDTVVARQEELDRELASLEQEVEGFDSVSGFNFSDEYANADF
jgi:hypothetical protein